MAKTQAEINELLASDLFQKGIKDKYIIINEGKSIIHYNCKNQTKRRLQTPEEFVQAETYLKLIYDYDYPASNISVPKLEKQIYLYIMTLIVKYWSLLNARKRILMNDNFRLP